MHATTTTTEVQYRTMRVRRDHGLVAVGVVLLLVLVAAVPAAGDDVFRFKHDEYIHKHPHRRVPAATAVATTPTAISTPTRAATPGARVSGWRAVLRRSVGVAKPALLLPVRLLASTYWGLRLALSHTLRPLLLAAAPLTYLLAGAHFLFLATPLAILAAIAADLYPLYIFLGAATLLGISIGSAAALVLYSAAFLLPDTPYVHPPPNPPTPNSQHTLVAHVYIPS